MYMGDMTLHAGRVLKVILVILQKINVKVREVICLGIGSSLVTETGTHVI